MGESDYFDYCRDIDLDKLDLYGRGYVIDHCVAARVQALEERRYRAYITDALKLIAENTARMVCGQYLTERWAEPFLPKDDRTPAQIVMDVAKSGGLILKGVKPA